MKSICVKLCVVCCALLGSMAWGDDPNELGLETICYAVSGEIQGSGGCPSWFEVFSRDGWDGGQLTVYLDACQVFDYEHYAKPQNGGYGVIADLEPDDIFIEWDEDSGHGDGTEKFFTFTGTYEVVGPNPYVYATTTDSQTEWTIYRVTSSGTLTKTGDCCNEHDAFHLTRNMMEFTKTDDTGGECRSPEESIVYQICWDNAFGEVLEDAYIVDYLPIGVTYPGAGWTVDFGDPNDPNYPQFTMIPPDPGYDETSHSYTWILDQIDPNTSDCVELTVVVNENAAPGQYLHNVAELWGTVYDANGLNPETRRVATAAKDTLVCCWGETVDTLYVDKNATGANNGMNWANAYTELQDALTQVANEVCGQVEVIYVAQETYFPGESEDDTFRIPEGVAVYGGFPTGGCDFIDRNPKRYETILTGLLDDEPVTRADTVVTMGDETLLDGFTITESYRDGQGIYASGADCSIVNCVVEKNLGYGAYFEDSNVEFTFSRIRDNESDGIYHSGEGFTLTLENCWIQRSRQYGVRCEYSTPTIKNSNVTESDLGDEGRQGIRLVNPTYPPVLQNVTCAHNYSEGIFFTDNHDVYNDPNTLDYPALQNCVIFHNNNGGAQLSASLNPDVVAHYSCIADCNSVNNNISTDPAFVYFDPDNVRISTASPCKDTGNPSLDYDDQVDMDNRERVLGTYVDRGAYEVIPDCQSDSHELDLNHDGLINLVEFSQFSAAWLSHDPNDPAWLADPNLVVSGTWENWYPRDKVFNFDASGSSQYSVDLADLVAFCEDDPQVWLWTACWKQEQLEEMMMSEGGESMMMALPMMEFSSMESAASMETAVEETPIIEEKSLEEQILDLEDAIDLLEQIWLDEPDIQQEIDAEDWKEFMDAVYQNLLDLQSENAYEP